MKICSFAHRSFTHSLKLLSTNEQMWAIHSGRSGQLSACEQIAQVAHDKWANMSDFHRSLRTNERMSKLLGFFEQVTHFLFHSGKMSDSIKKIKNIVFFVHFLQLFWNFLKKKKIRSFLLSKVRELLRSLRTNEWPWAICSGHSEGMSNHERIAQVAHQKFSKWVNHSLFEQIAHSLTFWQKRGFTPKFDERIPNQEKLEMKRNSKIIC